jgi:uncharacterized protein (DUF1810 family)
VSDDPFDLDRFVRAQEEGGTYASALAELRLGRKVGHWMWFVFPQLVGLGHSAMARRYGISSLEEARAYLAHPLLGARLREAAAVLATLNTNDATAVLGSIDAIKLRSSMTLFALAAPGEAIFQVVLERYYEGRPDPLTEARLARPPHR